MAKKNKEKKEPSEKKADSFQLKNYMLKVFSVWLDVPLHSEQAIARNRVLKLIEEKFEDFEKDRLDLIKRCGKKDDKGELVIGDDRNYIIEDQEVFDTEWELLRNQTVTFDVLPSNRSYWKTAREIVKNTKIEMDVATTDFYEEVLETLKTI